MAEEMIPTQEEVRRWLLDTTRHVMHIEYFFNCLGLGGNDSERPHDLIGPGNKFEWDVIKGFALQYRAPKVDFKEYIMPSLEIHRQQYHHRMWNKPSQSDARAPIESATYADMLVGALDANCSLLENRGYQGGANDYEGVREVALNSLKNPPHTTPWMLSLIPLMQRVEQPRLEDITDIHHIPNIGLPDQIYDRINQRTGEVLDMLKTKGYDL